MAWLAPWSAVLPSLAAFAVFGASAWACLLCFTSYEERLQICQIFAGLDSPDLGKCEEAFADAFKGLLDTEISEETIPCSPSSSLDGVPGDYEERGQLHDAFTQMTHSLQEMATAQGSFRVAFLRAAEKMQKIILQLKEDGPQTQRSYPPGLQEVTRRFRCRGCYSKVCDLPLDCPVTGPPPRGETELQVSFREVLRWVPQEAEMIEPWRPSLGELLARPEALTPGNQCLLAALVALASASVTVLVWMFFRWYCSGN
ncbi:hypothetical protein E5288_WYG021856 [Bos mutus]|uniref:Sperm acrosome membrane-associated protein 6 n=1 Tax=Bos mutus TaxID=72004 RepID=A0A6B0SDP8_9CETA|nr:hypothetical protein [Bos mutus]